MTIENIFYDVIRSLILQCKLIPSYMEIFFKPITKTSMTSFEPLPVLILILKTLSFPYIAFISKTEFNIHNIII